MSSPWNDFTEPAEPVILRLQLTGSQRLHLVEGSPWKGALGAFLADSTDGVFWSAPDDYARGDLLLTVLHTEPRMLLCLERASSKHNGENIEVDGDRVVFPQLVAVSSLEQLTGFSLPPAPASLSARRSRAVLKALESALGTPNPVVSESKKTTASPCRIATGKQAAALLLADGRCYACGQDFGCLLNGQGVAGLEVHQHQDQQLPSARPGQVPNGLVVLCGGCHLLAHTAGAPSMETLRFVWWPSCPQCEAHPPNEILWGMPIAPVEDPHITLGGCSIDQFPPARWHCTTCNYEWGTWA